MPLAQDRTMNIRPLLGLLGVLWAAMSADLNEFVSLTTLTDLRGALGISYDPCLGSKVSTFQARLSAWRSHPGTPLLLR